MFNRRPLSFFLAALTLAAGAALPLKAQSYLFYLELQGVGGYSTAAKKLVYYSQEQLEVMQKPSLGFDYIQRFSGESGDFAILAVQGRLAWNAAEGKTLEPQLYNAYLKFKLKPFDLWIGHERPSFGLASVLDSHGLLLQPLDMRGYGFDRDWGVGAQRDYRWGSAAASLTAGSGMPLYFKGNYLAAGPAPAPRLVSGGENDPLLPYLGEELTKATTADIAVGFVMPSGLERLGPHLRDFLARSGRLRLLTGDYLGVTEPDALTRLLDLEGDRHLRVFETAHPSGPEHPGPPAPLSFHPKAYIFERADGTGVAFVGSSNLSHSALSTGIEWNYRAVAKADNAAFQEIQTAFDRLFDHPATRELTPTWIAAYRNRRPTLQSHKAQDPADAPEEPTTIPTPHAIQQEALKALEETRRQRNTAGLVVLATGLGKTWLSAFDSHRPEFKRILFVAHREEILNQSRDTFRRIRPEARLGLYMSQERQADADVLFAYVFGLFKIAVIAQQIYRRFTLGHTRDPRFGALIHGVRILGRQSARALEAGRVDRLS